MKASQAPVSLSQTIRTVRLPGAPVVTRNDSAEVVAAVRGGLISLEEACERSTLTVDEFLSWQRSIDKHGLPGLRATRIQDYRGG